MALVNTIYNNLFRRTSTFALGVIGAAFFFERGLDYTAESIFESRNQGKLWQHIQHKYLSKEEEE